MTVGRRPGQGSIEELTAALKGYNLDALLWGLPTKPDSRPSPVLGDKLHPTGLQSSDKNLRIGRGHPRRLRRSRPPMTLRRAFKGRRRLQLAEAQNWRCAYCSGVMLLDGDLDASATIDHILPRRSAALSREPTASPPVALATVPVAPPVRIAFGDGRRSGSPRSFDHRC